ncbi:unnamed protein product [Amoebophrya sp. A25]|nr:unnamed protein product [Amoebophrya sp. A25]|eukprot:GSA25T00016781001.1
MANPGWRMLAVINPCNPTGAYMGIEELKAYIYRSVEANLPSLDRTLEDASEISEQHHDDLSCCVLVDESMQLWRGSCWREDSLVSQEAWVRHMYDSFKCSIFVIHSWTKIWSCPGIRLGSILCPTSAHSMKLKKHQVPWSLNLCALAFLSAAVADKEYLQQTWTLNLVWRARTKEVLSEVFPSWRFYGEEWLSWLWIDTKDAKVAAACVKYAKAHGVPIRNGAMGYDKPTFIRLAVRSPDKQDVLFSALRMAKKECGA